MTLLKEDFYEYVNQEWLNNEEIPSDKPSISSFSSLANDIENLLMTDVKKLASGNIPVKTKELQSFVDFYHLVTDDTARNQLGMTPLTKRLEVIESLKTITEWTNRLPELIMAGFSTPFHVFVSPDMKEANRYGLYLSPASLILPDTTYYSHDHPNRETLLNTYSEMMFELLNLIGKTEDEAKKIIKNNLDFDASLVPFIKSAEESADYTKQYNPRTMEEVATYHNDIDFNELLSTLLKTTPSKIIVTEPIFFEALNKLVTKDTFSQLKDWMFCQYILSFTNRLTEEFKQIANRYNLALSGAKESFSKEKTAFYMATGQFDQVIGQYYAENYFSEQAKQDVHHMVEKMIGIYQSRLENNTWLDKSTKEKAIVKLSTLSIQVGYPNKLHELYSLYETVSKENDGTLVGNIEHFNKIAYDYFYGRYGQEVDKEEWGMSANTVNAYYDPQQNVIVFPAAILQAPFYDLNQSTSANYGGIGAVIAHEISHAFDNNGAKFDEFGNLNNWWSEADLAHFDKLTKQMIDQFDGIPFGNGQVNGTLTVSENIADAGGLSCALEAAQLEDDYDGKDLFENWARIWRNKSQEQYTDLLLSVDVHGPAKLRANVQPQNLDEFYSLYDITPEDKMYLAPEKRVKIW